MDSILDPRRRRFLLPSRVVWTSKSGIEGAQNLLSDDHTSCIFKTGAGGAVLLDFGQEMHGGVRIDVTSGSAARPIHVRVRFGESVSEAMAEPNNDHAIHDWDMKVSWFGRTDVGDTGFRFVRIDLTDPDATLVIKNVHAVSLAYDEPYLGTFKCSDQRLNRIWEVGAQTVHLCMQDHLWDGIKRDRLVWLGDMHPETMVVTSLFGAHPIVPASLDKVRNETPLPKSHVDGVNPFGGSPWMNGISSYSLWWIIIQRDWYRYHGDLIYLQEQREYLTGLLDLVLTRIDDTGKETLDSRFLEWPTSTDPTAIDAGLQALTAIALRAAAELCGVLGEMEAANRAAEAAARAERYMRPPSESKQANALLALAGMADAVDTNERILAKDPDRRVSTFYGYYVLQARALAGDYTGCLDLLRSFWGGMIDLGATTFWEDFNLEWTPNATGIEELPVSGRPDIHADFGDFCYKGLRHSLCHGWAAGPTAWLMEHVLGVSPAAPGFSKVAIRPNLGGLTYARGTFPTPHGIITVSHELQADGTVKSDIMLPEGVERV